VHPQLPDVGIRFGLDRPAPREAGIVDGPAPAVECSPLLRASWIDVTDYLGDSVWPVGVFDPEIGHSRSRLVIVLHYLNVKELGDDFPSVLLDRAEWRRRHPAPLNDSS
jgi:hypothetical protein